MTRHEQKLLFDWIIFAMEFHIFRTMYLNMIEFGLVVRSFHLQEYYRINNMNITSYSPYSQISIYQIKSCPRLMPWWTTKPVLRGWCSEYRHQKTIKMGRVYRSRKVQIFESLRLPGAIIIQAMCQTILGQVTLCAIRTGPRVWIARYLS